MSLHSELLEGNWFESFAVFGLWLEESLFMVEIERADLNGDPDSENSDSDTDPDDDETMSS